MNELWRPIDMLGYEVSNFGRVRSIPRIVGKKQLRGKIINPYLSNSGYYFVSLTGSHTKRYIHRLVARAFIGKFTKEKPQVNHKDGNRQNNLITNLELSNQSENLVHAHKVLGHKVHNIKLDKSKAETIRKLYKDGVPQRQLAKRFNVSVMTINRLINFVQYEYR